MNHRQLWSWPGTPAAGVPASDAGKKSCHESRIFKALAALLVGVLSLGVLAGRTVAAQVINFPAGFSNANLGNNPGQIFVNNAGYLSGSSIQIGDSTGHRANNAWYTTPINVQAFTTTFTFHFDCSINPSECGNGFGFMMISSSPSNPTYNPPSNLGFTYSGFSSAQLSWSECQDNGNSCPFYNAMLVKFSLFDVNTNLPGAEQTGYYINGAAPAYGYGGSVDDDMSAAGINMQSGDEFRCTITYNGAILTEVLTDTVTGHSYTISYAADIPNAIGSDTSLVGFGAGTGEATMYLYIDSWTYTVNASGASVPTYSIAGGNYGSAQPVSLSTSSPGAVICYSTTQAPRTDGSSGCSAGTRYTGSPVAVATSATLYAVAGGAGYNDSIPIGAATYLINSQVASPILSLPSGSYAFPQSATATTTTTQTVAPVTMSAIFTCSTTYGATCTPSTGLTGALTINAASTVCANATNAGFTASSTVCYNYAGAKAATTTTVQAMPTSVNSGQNVTLTATVTSQSGSATPTGMVTFYNGGTSLGVEPLGSSGTASLSSTTLATGSDSITASYGGDSGDAVSTSTAITVVVTQSAVATTTTLKASATQVTSGQSVAFTAKVVPQSGKVVPAGSIKFFDGTTPLGKASLNASGTATLSTASLAAGTHSITASYFGNSQDSSSVSSAVSVVVTQSR